MIQYALRQKSTGYFMLRHKHKNYSYDEPRPENEAYGPRLFHSKRAASIALSAWLAGHWTPYYHLDSYGNEDFRGHSPTKVPGRNKEDMEIVCYRLQEIDKWGNDK